MTVFLHIGYHKTASTWLQRQIFPEHPSIEYWPTQMPEHAWLPELARVHDFAFDVERYRGLYLECRSKRASDPIVVSWEGFVGDPLSGAQTSVRNADRLHSIFPNAQILIVIRNQLDMVDSLYRQYVQEGGTCSLERFLDLRPQNRVYFGMDYLRYDLLIGHYRSSYGSDAVHVFLYEELAQSPSDFLAKLFSTIDVEQQHFDGKVLERKINRSLSLPSLYLLRFANHFLSSALNPGAILANRWVSTFEVRRWLQTRLDRLIPDRSIARQSCIGLQLRSELEDQFRLCNRTLVEELGIPLEEYGYAL